MNNRCFSLSDKTKLYKHARTDIEADDTASGSRYHV